MAALEIGKARVLSEGVEIAVIREVAAHLEAQLRRALERGERIVRMAAPGLGACEVVGRLARREADLLRSLIGCPRGLGSIQPQLDVAEIRPRMARLRMTLEIALVTLARGLPLILVDAHRVAEEGHAARKLERAHVLDDRVEARVAMKRGKVGIARRMVRVREPDLRGVTERIERLAVAPCLGVGASQVVGGVLAGR